jgi:hypothetical protein
VRPLPPVKPLPHLCFPSLPPSVEVSYPKIINITQYLNSNNFSSNLHKQHNFVLQKYFYKQFSCHHIKNHFSSQIFLKLTFSDAFQSHDYNLPQHDMSYIIFSMFEDIQHQFSWSWHEKKTFFVTNLVKINIFWFSSITRLKPHPTRHIRYLIFFILDDIPHVSLDEFNIWLSKFFWVLNYHIVHSRQWGPCLQ